MSDPPPTPTATSQTRDDSPSLPESSSSTKKRRGAIAAQACDTCRQRKQRCDEQRPKCGTCRNLDQPCNYREAPPTKKDKTMVEILERVKNLEEHLQRLGSKLEGVTSQPSNPVFSPISVQPNNFAHPDSGILVPAHPAASFHLSDTSHFNLGGEDQYKYVSSVHEMLGWPAISQLLSSIQSKVPNHDISSSERDGVAIMLSIHRCTDECVPIEPLGPTAKQSAIDKPGLSWDNLHALSKAYFDTFNPIYPILDHQSFMTETLPSVFNDGFSPSATSAVVFLVFALGEVALAGFDGPPIHVYNGRASGVRGGSKGRPPGVEWFNEARRRMGFHLSEVNLENIQMFALAGTYHGTCFCPTGFWRMTRAASQACQALIDSNPRALSGPDADLIRRAFWHCSIMETCLNLELGFPLPGLQRLEETVGLPGFDAAFYKDPYLSDQESHIQEHLASQIALRRMLVDFHNKLSQSTTAQPFSSAWTSPLTIRLRIQQAALELGQWRGLLPAHFIWPEDSHGAFPNSMAGATVTNSMALHPPANTAMSPGIMQARSSSIGSSSLNATPPQMFTTDLDSPPAQYPYAFDVQAALLRSRYYYAKYLIHRPFLYKALHYPESMTDDDALGVAHCLKASLKWPIAMSPTCKRKRLVPCMFFFTQSFFGILVLLHLSTTVPILRNIRATLCGDRFETDARETVGLYLDWLRDLKVIDVGTVWHWDVVKAIYGLED